MTTTRPEIVVEGSDDGQQWREYEFRYKPGALSRPPPWNIPHQPRLDWQMWFAALGDPAESRGSAASSSGYWRTARRCLRCSPANPFPDHPPKYVRAMLYDYRFADPTTHAATGQWWVRREAGIYFPAVGLPGVGNSDVEQ